MRHTFNSSKIEVVVYEDAQVFSYNNETKKHDIPSRRANEAIYINKQDGYQQIRMDLDEARELRDFLNRVL